MENKKKVRGGGLSTDAEVHEFPAKLHPHHAVQIHACSFRLEG